ncbi:PAS domain S-box protein [Salinispira pacifica]
MGTEARSLLLVEDEAIIALDESVRLERAGYRVTHVLTGEAAIEQVISRPGDYDIILMDINLGKGIDGTEAAQRILAARDVPILFLSSHREPEVVTKTEQITNYGYVVKSSDFSVLDASIKMALRLFDAHRTVREKSAEAECRNEQLRLALRSLESSNAELALAEDKFSKAFHLNPHTMNMNRVSDGIYIDINEGFTRFMGYTREEAIGRSSLPGGLGVWTRSEDRERLSTLLRAEGVVENFETEMRLKGGRIAAVSVSARLVDIGGAECILSVTRDVTEAKKAEEGVRQREELFKTAFANAAIAIVLINHDGTFRAGNARMAELVGRRPEELPGLHFLDLVHSEDRALYSGATEAVAHGSSAQRRVSLRLLRGRQPVCIEQTIGVVKDESGRPTCFVCHIFETTASLERSAELRLRELRHRVKNNLETVVSLVHLAARNSSESSPEKIFMDTESRIRTLSLMYDELSKTETGEQLELSSYLERIIEQLRCIQGADERGIDIRFEASPAVVPSRIAASVGLIVNELVTNAVKHAFVQSPGGTIEVRLQKLNGQLHLSVKDDGRGIPPDSRLASPTSTGLTLIRMLCEELGGKLDMSGGDGTEVGIIFEASAPGRQRS